MSAFHKFYQPLTARPFLSDQTYREYQPCLQLRPYIACYWRMDEGMNTHEQKDSEVLVIPDTCMDIIILINHTRQTISGYFCGMQDEPALAATKESTDIITSFAIRFYFWSAHLFLNLDFKSVCNQKIGLEHLGKEWSQLFEPFFYINTMKERIAMVETHLLRKLNSLHKNPNLFNSIHQVLTAPGRVSVKDICLYSGVSQRQIERLFLQEVGLPLKRISNLIRYQNVWRDMVWSPQFDIQDAVYRYGYTDQAHLLKEFKRFHGISPKEANNIAIKNQ